MTVIKRILNRVNVDENDCWLFQGAKQSDGYGVVKHREKAKLAHRITYFVFKGKIPKGEEIDHLCKTRNCCNPNHLEAVTHAENIRRGDAKKAFLKMRKNQTHCKRGHKFDEKNTRYKYRKNGVVHRNCIACEKFKYKQRKERKDDWNGTQ